jgi:hypothetical protein
VGSIPQARRETSIEVSLMVVGRLTTLTPRRPIPSHDSIFGGQWICQARHSRFASLLKDFILIVENGYTFGSQRRSHRAGSRLALPTANL